MKKFMAVMILLATGVCAVWTAPAGAAAPWSVLKPTDMDKARRAGGRAVPDAESRAAIEIIRRADLMIQKDRSEANLKAALAIYAQAGQMLEKAANEYMALVPGGQATRADVEGALGAMRRCVTSIKQVQAHYADSR